MRKIANQLGIVFTVLTMFLWSCGGSGTENTDSGNSESSDVEQTMEDIASADAEEVLDFQVATKEDFLNIVLKEDGMPRTYDADNQDYIFFRKDGTFAGGGEGGEETLWEGDWSWQGNKAVLNSSFFEGEFIIMYFPDDGALSIGGVEYYANDQY